jgi:hypothetical protein
VRQDAATVDVELVADVHVLAEHRHVLHAHLEKKKTTKMKMKKVKKVKKVG